MKSMNIKTLLAQAASPPPVSIQSKRGVSVRIEEPLARSLESMAKACGKTASGLAGELLEAMVYQFSEELAVLRPDLVHELTMEEAADRSAEASHFGTEPDFGPVLLWLTPEAARHEYNLELARETQALKNQAADELEQESTDRTRSMFQ